MTRRFNKQYNHSVSKWLAQTVLCWLQISSKLLRPFKNEMGIQNTRVIFKSAIQTADTSHRCSEDTPTQQTEEREWVREQVLFRFYSHTPFTSQKSSKRKYKSPSSCSVSLNLCLFKLHKICSWLIIIF